MGCMLSPWSPRRQASHDGGSAPRFVRALHFHACARRSRSGRRSRGTATALRGGLLTSHVAPLTAFALVMAFATVLALTGLISRRAGEATILLAAAAFMIQRLASHWRISRARGDGRAAIGRLQSAAVLKATFGDEALSFDMDGRILNLPLRRLRTSGRCRRSYLRLAAERRAHRGADSRAG